MIEIEHLHKFYDRRPVLNDISLSVREGSILGLLGPNGAGKTTLVSILTGVIPKDRGRVLINGRDLDRDLKAIRSECSIVPQTFAFYPTLTARENLEYFGALYGLEGRMLKSRMDRAVDIGSLHSFLHKKAEKCSGGMKRRLNLSIGLLHNPRILYLDEPTVGVDAQSRNYILETIRKINREEKTTIVYASHYMDEVEQISDDIAIIDEGRILLHDRREAVLTQTGKVAIRVESLGAALRDRLQRMDGIQIGPKGILVERDENFLANMTQLFSLFEREQVEIREMTFGYKNLEDLFLNLTNEALRDH
jgi:ABC-2 type transport system ATP-binding protein